MKRPQPEPEPEMDVAADPETQVSPLPRLCRHQAGVFFALLCLTLD